MSLVKKIKDILFEEEEVTEPIKTIEPQVKEEIKEQPVRMQKPQSQPTYEREPMVNVDRTREVQSERDLFKTDSGFKFPDFDEEEFKSSMPKRTKTTNVLEYERKKSTEKRTDYGRYERVETKEIVEKKKFKPSPIISPVYGVLNQDYKPEDIKDKTEEIQTLDFDEVRKRAFAPEKIEELKEIETIDEPVVTFFEEKENVTLKEKAPREDIKTIDELLESASEDEITLEEELEMPINTNIDEIEEQLENFPETPEKESDLDDTLESDLFELIDSMYETREDGEE